MSLSNEQTENSVQKEKDTLWRALLPGSMPLLVLISISLLTLIVEEIVRQLSEPAGFLIAQRNELIVLGAGLLLVIAGYISTISFLLRRLMLWRERGLRRRATIVLWCLGATALLTLIPIILALATPQHPAP